MGSPNERSKRVKKKLLNPASKVPTKKAKMAENSKRPGLKRKSQQGKPVQKKAQMDAEKPEHFMKSVVRRKQQQKLNEKDAMMKKYLKNKYRNSQKLRRKYVSLAHRRELIRRISPAISVFRAKMSEYHEVNLKQRVIFARMRKYMDMLQKMRLDEKERICLMSVLDEHVKLVKCHQVMILEILFELVDSAVPHCTGPIRLRRARLPLKQMTQEQNRSTTSVITNGDETVPEADKRKVAETIKAQTPSKPAAPATKSPKIGPIRGSPARAPVSKPAAAHRRSAREREGTSPLKSSSDKEEESSNARDRDVTTPFSSKGKKVKNNASASAKKAKEHPKKTARASRGGKGRSRKRSASSDHTETYVPGTGPEEPTYCTCNRISFGDMIGCDNDKCTIEWFHFECVNLKTKPKGKKWYCPDCRGDRPTQPKKA
ncbi:hypothetical protein L596_025074 [Steinernema carpocapsae]|uniref:PHD-type domain-containing protein n=1 Tax=Steinernema carpocapsae TaxID=34508 RepID=A0A4U5M6S6_STECR|nr:hypothetical protein L596_025074 [Steinernema carpocapsae]